MNALSTLGNSLSEIDLGLTGLEPLLAIMMVVIGVSAVLLARDEFAAVAQARRPFPGPRRDTDR